MIQERKPNDVGKKERRVDKNSLSGGNILG
jgi:hypothetical protein